MSPETVSTFTMAKAALFLYYSDSGLPYIYRHGHTVALMWRKHLGPKQYANPSAARFLLLRGGVAEWLRH